MLLTDEKVVEHLVCGGEVSLPSVSYAYVKIRDTGLWWFDCRTNRPIAPVDGFADLVSREWKFGSHKKEVRHDDQTVR